MEKVAVVLAGAGARGGYEAGVLSVLLPRLQAAGVAVSMYVGTSAGAINATLCAAFSHLPPAEMSAKVLDVWRQLAASDVFASPVLQLPRTAAQFVGDAIGLPRSRPTQLLDTSPLWRTAERVIDEEQLRSNVIANSLTVAVVTGAGRDNLSVVFAHTPDPDVVPVRDPKRPIDYVAVDGLKTEHVLASSAIPLLFPPVRVQTPSHHAGWYIDGGVHMNAPLKPAVELGADRMIVVATHPVTETPAPFGPDDPPPDLSDMLVGLMDATLIDRMVEDLRTLSTINDLLLGGGAEGGRTRTGEQMRVIPYLAVTPEHRGTIGELARQAIQERPSAAGGLTKLLRQSELWLLGRALQGNGNRQGDLISFLYFEPSFIEATIELGRRDAERACADMGPGHVPWMLTPTLRESAG